jgi:hypothetical protein
MRKKAEDKRERERERERESKEWRENFLCIYVEGVEMMISRLRQITVEQQFEEE